jgi:hypothetical protein
VKTFHTNLREDVGRLDRNLVRSELLSAGGVAGVLFETARNALTVTYDPALIDDAKLFEIMLRYGVATSAPRQPGAQGKS